MGGNADTGMMDLSGPQGGGVAFSRALGRRKEKSRQPARCEQGYARTLLLQGFEGEDGRKYQGFI